MKQEPLTAGARSASPRYLKYLILLILLSSYANASLRLDADNPITMYRLLLPVVLLLLFSMDRSRYWKLVITSALLVAYAFIACILSRFAITLDNIKYLVDYIVVIVTCFFTLSVQARYGRDWVWDHLIKCFYVFIFLAFVQKFTGINYPNVQARGFNSVNLFYWNENDFSLVLSMVILAVVISKKRNFVMIAMSCAAAFIVIFNDSKVAILGVAIALLIKLIAPFVTMRNVLISAVVLLSFIAVILYQPAWLNQDIGFRGNFTINLLIVEPVQRIITLNPYPQFFGSIAERVNGAIFGIHEYFVSWGVGIGPGNSVSMLALPQYSFENMKSLHNFPLQLLLEFGFMAIWGFLVLIKYLKNKANLFGNLGIFTSLFTGILIISLSQSAGILSNFFFFVITTHLISAFEYHTA